MKKKTARSTTVSRSSVSTVTQQYSEEVKSFIVHLILYLLINFGLFIYLYSNSSKDLMLFYWVVVGWGVGVIAHALAVFGAMKYLHKEW